MEPFSMMLGYGLIQSAMQLVVKPVADQMMSGSKQRDLFDQMERKQQLDLEITRLNKELDYRNAANLQTVSHRMRLQEAQQQFENQLALWNTQQVDTRVWPLRTPLTDPGLRFHAISDQQVPVNMFFTRVLPQGSYARLFQNSVKDNLISFLQNAYACQSHPQICRIGDWKDGFQDPAFIQTLWTYLQGQPTLVLNPILTDSKLRVDVSSWGLAQTGHAPTTVTVMEYPYATEMGRIAREETIQWIENDLPYNSDVFKNNVCLLDKEKTLRKNGRSQTIIDKLLPQYEMPVELIDQVVPRFSRDFSFQLDCIAGMYTDIYHLIEYGTAPRLPSAIQHFNQQNGYQLALPQVAIEGYHKTLTSLACCNYFKDELPRIYLDVAQTIGQNSNEATQLVCEGIGLWANRKRELGQEVAIPKTLDDCVRLIRDNTDGRDARLIRSMSSTLQTIGENGAMREINQIALPAPKTFWQPENETESIEISATDLQIVWDELQKRIVLAERVRYFVFIVWNPDVIIGTFTDEDYYPVKFDRAAKNRFFIFYRGNNELPSEGKRNLYYLDFQNNRNGEVCTMKESEKRYEDRFEEIGRKFGQGLDSIRNGLRGERTEKRSSSQKTGWRGSNDRSSSGDLTGQLIAFFQTKLKNAEISAEPVENIEMEMILDWVKGLPSIKGNQIYIVKGYSNELKKYLICVFFANDKDLYLEEGDDVKCFVCKKMNRDFEDVFQGNDVYRIPIE